MNLEQLILKETQYQGNKEPHQKQLSASDFGSDILKIYLRYKYGVPDKEEFGQDTLGTIVHIGLQSLFKDKYEIEKSLEKEFSNGWKLTGSIDLINHKNREIIDIKVTKQYTIERVLQEPNHQYIWQLSVYKYLAEKFFDREFDVKLLLVLKDGGYDFRKAVMKPSLELLEIKPKSHKEIEDKFNEIVSKIEAYEELGEKPEQCDDLWFRKIKGQSVPLKCEQYCSYKKVCPYYKKNPLSINF